MPKETKCTRCGSKWHYQTFCPLKKNKPPKQRGKKAEAWDEEREQWFIDNPAEIYACHYCYCAMDKQNTTLDHENNRNHKGRLLPCCWFDNGRKGSMSHDNYVKKYYPGHKCTPLT